MEENMIQEETNENVDNLLNSVSDEYLAKKKRTRIISYSIISTLVLALAVIVIVMSCINVDLKPQFLGRALSYRVTVSNREVLTLDENSDEYQEFNDEFAKAFQSQYLTALFTGKLGGYKIEETNNNFYSSSTSTSPSSSLTSEIGENYVRVMFDDTKQILNSDGSVYYTQINTNKTFTFNEMYFKLNTKDSGEETTLYLGGITQTENGKDVVKIVKINVRANTYKLYKMATE